MSNLPECLQPVVEQIEKYEVQITALESKTENLDNDISSLRDEKQRLEDKIQVEISSAEEASKKFDTEKLTLRELNVVVSTQLREKIEELNSLNDSKTELEAENGHFKNLNTELSEQKNQADTQQLRASVGNEALNQKTEQMSEELDALRTQNKSLSDENSALTLVNSAMHQRQAHALSEQGTSAGENSALVVEIERLKNELSSYVNDNSDLGFLKSENQRLTQRHGEITQEKMQASAKMHVAQNELTEVDLKLQTAIKSIEQLEFEHQGLQNLHKNLTDERNALANDNGDLVTKRAQLDEKIQHQGEVIQRITTEKEMVVQELNQEHIKADAMTEEVNHLRMKSRTLAEDIKNLKEGMEKATEDTFEPQVQALEIDMNTQTQTNLDIEIVSSNTDTSANYPGAFHHKQDDKS
ncbi:MAG: hypothetical protein COA44_07770 [Arcobacter sp.]|nr:MAG: hypothetical protein COA44_07770 [Arcobacter sp.]